MIIRRISKGIKEQDWFVVMVEVLIVVVGIFIGLQVDDWNEARKKGILEIAYMERLLEEAEYNSEHLYNLVDMHLDVKERAIRVAEYVDGGIQDDEKIKILSQTNLRAGLFPNSSVRSGTYLELISTGNINILRNDELKRNLLSFEAQNKRTEGQLEFSRSNYEFYRNLINKARKTTFLPEKRFGSQANYDAVLGDQDFLDALGSIHRRHELMAIFYKEGAETMDNIVAILRCELFAEACHNKVKDQ